MAIDLLTYEFLKRYVEGSQMGQYAKPQGKWDETKTYSTGDYVTYNNTVYIVPFNPNASANSSESEKIQTVTETKPGTDETKWQKIAGVDITIDDIDILNIENGSGDKSLQQVLDTTTWTSSNEKVKEYVENSTTTADGARIDGSAEGDTVTINVGAKGKLSTMMNGKSQTVGGKSHAEGSKTIAFENNSHAEGNDTFAAGKHSHTEGNTTTAIGNSAHAEGAKTLAEANYSHSEGESTKATGVAAHAQNFYTEATGDYSHAEGNNCEATNSMAHAEGYETEASGYAAHSQGGRTKAKGAYTLAGGFENIASADYQTVIGKANKEEIDKLFIIGNGDLNSDYSVKERKNVLTVDTSGNVELPILNSGLILVSEGGRRFKLAVDNLGVLTTTPLN